MSENDGQHRSPGNSSGPGSDRGQTGRRNAAAEVGQENGAEANMRVPAAKGGIEVTRTTTCAHEEEGEPGEGPEKE